MIVDGVRHRVETVALETLEKIEWVVVASQDRSRDYCPDLDTTYRQGYAKEYHIQFLSVESSHWGQVKSLLSRPASQEDASKGCQR